MANEQNLKPQNKRTKSEQREIAKKGGIKSGEARRRKKALKETMQMLLDLPVADTKAYNNMSKFGIEIDEMEKTFYI